MDGIKRFLSHGPNEKLCDAWRNVPYTPGKKSSIQDGDVWQKHLRDPDGGVFFDNSPTQTNTDELRLGITLGFDG